jgi:hypothetical protein
LGPTQTALHTRGGVRCLGPTQTLLHTSGRVWGQHRPLYIPEVGSGANTDPSTYQRWGQVSGANTDPSTYQWWGLEPTQTPLHTRGGVWGQHRPLYTPEVGSGANTDPTLTYQRWGQGSGANTDIWTNQRWGLGPTQTPLHTRGGVRCLAPTQTFGQTRGGVWGQHRPLYIPEVGSGLWGLIWCLRRSKSSLLTRHIHHESSSAGTQIQKRCFSDCFISLSMIIALRNSSRFHRSI